VRRSFVRLVQKFFRGIEISNDEVRFGCSVFINLIHNSMKVLLLLLLIPSICSAQVKHAETSDKDMAYVQRFNFNKMNEPDLYKDTSSNESYRFTWIRSFHKPLVIRIERSADRYNLYWKEWSGEGGYSWGKIIVDDKKSVDESAWREFKDKLHKADFMGMTIQNNVVGTDQNDVIVIDHTDGAHWILEGKTATTYHVVDRWSPGASSTYYRCCDFLISLTGLEIKSDDKY